jgi:hypothetical protein
LNLALKKDFHTFSIASMSPPYKSMTYEVVFCCDEREVYHEWLAEAFKGTGKKRR